jgi:hypothetical protein
MLVQPLLAQRVTSSSIIPSEGAKMPLSSFRQAVVERKIELAIYTIKMVGRSIPQLERGQRDASLARRYLDETISGPHWDLVWPK